MEKTYDLIAIGGGPAAYSAAIYAGRAGLDVHIIDEGMGGGQLATSPLVENYPGYDAILGMELADKMKKQALKYATMSEGYKVMSLEKDPEGFLIASGDKAWRSKTVMISTGAKHRKLGADGESEFYGKGVSYCATCDGFFFRGKKVLVVGGGDSALSEARYLLSLGAEVLVVHRRDELRAEKTKQRSFFDEGGKVEYEHVVKAFRGGDALQEVLLENVKTGETKTVPADGAFVAIGYEPRNLLAKDVGCELSPDGYVITDIRQRTCVPGIFAAGDITGGLKQVVTAVGQGAKAGLAAFQDLEKPYWLEQR